MDEPQPVEDAWLDEVLKDISDIIEFPQLPKGRISTRDLRGQPFSSTELVYKLSLIRERFEAKLAEHEAAAEARGELRGRIAENDKWMKLCTDREYIHSPARVTTLEFYERNEELYREEKE